MADLNEQMTSLLEKEELPYADDATAATDYITKPFARETRKYAGSPSKPFNPIESQALLESYKPKIKEKRQEDRFEENIDTAKSIGTGVLTGFAGLPSDILEGVNFVNDYLAEKGSPKALIFKDAINEAREKYGRAAFDKKFTEITGIESDASNIDQIVGEILSPAGAFVATAKGGVKATQGAIKLYDFLQDAFKTQTNLLRGDIPPGGATQLVTGNVDNVATQMGNINQIKNKEVAAAAVDAAKTTKTANSGEPNQPIINLSEIGVKTPDGAKAANIYRIEEGKELAKIGMGNDYTAEGYAKLSDEVKDRLYKETGVYRGQLGKQDPDTKLYPDGKLRYKISTADFQFNEGYLKDLGVIEGGFNSKNIPTEGITLEQMLNAKDLYRNYSKVASNGDYGLIKDIKVKNFDAYINERKLDPDEAMTQLEGTQAIYSRHEGVETIYVRGGKSSDVRGNLLHEIQHAIQHREGFNAGSSQNRFLYDTDTNFGSTYVGLKANVNIEKKVARSAFEQSPVGRTLDKELLESVTDKLVRREYKNIVGQYNKTESSGYFEELPIADIGSFDKTGVQLMVEPKVYKGYDTRDIRFTMNEEKLANDISRSSIYQDYIKKRIITQHKARNLVLMETKAHKLYIKAPGEVQARKIVEDDIEYQRILKMAEKDPRVNIPRDPVERDIFINNIFRRTMRPSEKGVLQGQNVKVDSSGNTTSPIRAEGK